MDWLSLSFACTCIFIAAIVRGFSGFGFSLLAITSLSLLFAPRDIVPSIFMLEIAASIHLLPSIWKEVHWRSLIPLTLGCLVATPLGVYLLAHVPVRPMQIALALFVLVATALLWRGFTLKTMPGNVASTAAGAAAGLANGAFGIGGPPVVLFYFSSPAGHVAGRASLIMFFLLTDVIGLANQSVHGLVTWDALTRATIFLPALIAGVWLGQKQFVKVDQAVFRKGVLLILALLALIILAKALSEIG
jgi:uncharacterized protein